MMGRTLAILLTFISALVYVPDSFADCASAPVFLYWDIEIDTDPEIVLDESPTSMGTIFYDECNYEVVPNQGILRCGHTNPEDENKVTCRVKYQQIADAEPETLDSALALLYPDNAPSTGCGSVTTLATPDHPEVTSTWCHTTGRDDNPLEVDNGWREEGTGRGLPGVEEGDIEFVTPVDPGEGGPVACPEGYDFLNDSEFLCADEEASYSYHSGSFYSPGTGTGGSGEEGEEGEGVDICVEHPNILACQDSSILDDTGPDYDEDDYQADLDESIDLPDVTLDPGDLLLSSDGSCQTISLSFWGETIAFPNAYICGLFEIGRGIAAFGFYLITAIGVFFLIIKGAP